MFTVTLPTDKSVYDEKDFLIPGNVLLKEQEEQAACLSDATEQPAGLFAGNGLSAAAGQNGTAGSGQNTAPAAPLNKRKVLIIEDDNDIRAFLKEEVEAYFEVEVAEDGTAGLEKARAYDADLIICDVLMPGMNGFEVTRRLKADFETCHIPIVLLTALGSTERQLEGIKAGADAYIPKPFSVRLLLARVFQLIAQRDKLRDKFSNEPGIGRTAIFTCDRDKEFSERLVKVVEENLARPEFTVEEFGRLMGLGRTVFFKKIRGVTGYSPNEYLRVVRMKKGAELLLSPERYTVSEVAYKVGLNDPFYFSKCFKAQFGISPSVYQKGGKPKEEEQGETKPV